MSTFSTCKSIAVGSCLLLLMINSHPASATKSDPVEIRNYIFGNSLIHHFRQNQSDETSVPHWLHHLAKAAGNSYKVDGQWGFLRNFAKDLPPRAGWSFKDVRRVWEPSRGPFSAAPFNAIMINPANFIQYKSPESKYDGDNPDNQTPLGATLVVIDWLNSQKPGLPLYIYEGWALLSRVAKEFPPSDANMKEYHIYNRGEYHDWYVKYVDLINNRLPNANAKLIPVASLIAKMLTETGLRGLRPKDLYSDLAPHGTETTYFLAALVTYSVMYKSKAPEKFVVPPSVHPLVKANYQEVIALVCEEVVKSDACQTSAKE